MKKLPLLCDVKCFELAIQEIEVSFALLISESFCAGHVGIGQLTLREQASLDGDVVNAGDIYFVSLQHSAQLFNTLVTGIGDFDQGYVQNFVGIHFFQIANQLFVQLAILLVYDEDELFLVALISRRNVVTFAFEHTAQFVSDCLSITILGVQENL